MDLLSRIEGSLKQLKENNLYRQRIILEKDIIDFSSNDYLALADCKETKEKLCKKIESLSLGSKASALISGYHQIQKDLEEFLADFKETESCIVVGSGYLANTGLIQAITTEDDIILSDQFNHASIIDGIRLSKAKKVIYRHNDMNDLEDKLKKNTASGIRYIITDGVFSMEGDIVNYPDLKFLSEKYRAVIIIDDAHSTGVLGDGKGTVFHFGLKPDENVIQVGTLSKAVGSYGAFICGAKAVIDYLVNKMRTQIFSTALSPIQNFVSLENLKIIKSQPERIKRLFKLCTYLSKKSEEEKLPLNYNDTPIFTLIIGEEKKALRIREMLLEKGLFVQAIRPPTVPQGSSRLRITVSYKHTENDINLLVKSLKESLESYNG